MSRELPADDAPRASILITAFNPPTFERCLDALVRNLPRDLPCEVIATLNGPSDSLLEAAHGIEGLRTVDTPVNLGMAAGLNLARDAARGELMVMLQDDAEIERGWLEALVEAADAHPDAGAVGGVICWPDGEYVQSAGVVLWADATQSAVGEGTAREDWSGREPFAVDYCASNALLVRAETWDAIGGPDEAFFPVGQVDADLGTRIWRSGRAVLVEPRARSRHKRGASSPKPFKLFINVRNVELFRERWGAQLAHTQEARGEAGPAELDRALARAAERRTGLAERKDPPPVPAPRRTAAPDPVAAADRLLRLHLAYEAELEPALEHFEAEVVALRKRVDELSALVAERDRKLVGITGGGWWRLRERLLPLLRPAAALRERVRR